MEVIRMILPLEIDNVLVMEILNGDQHMLKIFGQNLILTSFIPTDPSPNFSE
jgi:hypothetical protein